MVGMRTLTLATLLAAAVSSSPLNSKRGSTTATVVFRTDLKAGEGQSDQFKDLILSTVANNNTVGGYDITFVSKCEKDVAAGAVIKSKGIPLTTNSTGIVRTNFMNVATVSSQSAPQPVKLGTAPQSLGFLYETSGELKLGSTMPQWDTWVVCDGILQTGCRGFTPKVLNKARRMPQAPDNSTMFTVGEKRKFVLFFHGDLNVNKQLDWAVIDQFCTKMMDKAKMGEPALYVGG
ncbi:MAG: hypothetical protein Q9213_002091 [Squamulea squamosa]